MTGWEENEALRKEFQRDTLSHWANSQGEPDIDYVHWLEGLVIKLRTKLPSEEREKYHAKYDIEQLENAILFENNTFEKLKDEHANKIVTYKTRISYLKSVISGKGAL